MSVKSKWEKIIVVLIAIIFLSWAYLIFKIYYFSNLDTKKQSNAIVVMGASQWNGRPSPVFQSRLDHALGLYKDGLADKIILTGGVGDGEKISESIAGKNYLIEKGISSPSIFIEGKGRTSLQSLNQVKGILKDQNLKSIIIVSDGFHMMRLNKMAKDLGIDASLSPVRNGPINNNRTAQFKYIFRESTVYPLYLIFKI